MLAQNRHGDDALKPKGDGSPESLFLNEKEYRTYGLRQVRRAAPTPDTAPFLLDSYGKDQYYPYHHSDLLNSYSLPPGKQAISSKSYHHIPRVESYLTVLRHSDRVPTDYSHILRADDKGRCGDSEVDDIASCYNGVAVDFLFAYKENKDLKELMKKCLCCYAL